MKFIKMVSGYETERALWVCPLNKKWVVTSYDPGTSGESSAQECMAFLSNENGEVQCLDGLAQVRVPIHPMDLLVYKDRCEPVIWNTDNAEWHLSAIKHFEAGKFYKD